MAHSRSKKEPSTRKTKADDDSEPLNFEVGRAIEYLLAKRTDTVAQLLKDAGLSTSGNKRAVEKRLLAALTDGHITPAQIIEHLDRLPLSRFEVRPAPA